MCLFTVQIQTGALLWRCCSSGKIDTVVWNPEASRECLQCIRAEFVLDTFELDTFELYTLQRRKCFHIPFPAPVIYKLLSPLQPGFHSCKKRYVSKHTEISKLHFLGCQRRVQQFDSSLSKLTDYDPFNFKFKFYILILNVYIYIYSYHIPWYSLTCFEISCKFCGVCESYGTTLLPSLSQDHVTTIVKEI